MDEAEKYKQRLEAIAEKRRLQEEQDKARREMEDEKLRLQQLKRKSLRDQWLMEGGAPLSPTSLDAHSPRSPLWGTQAQDMEKHDNKLQSEHQRLAEEQEKLEELTEAGQMEAVNMAEAGEETTQHVQNGENNGNRSETVEVEVKINQGPLLDETAAVLTNGGGNLEANTNHSAFEQNSQSTTNGPTEETEGAVGIKLDLGLSVCEAEPGKVSDVIINEEEEGTLVMRAECVIITDEGDDVPEDLTPQEDHQESVQQDETPLPNPKEGKGEAEVVEEVVKTETAPETFTESERRELTHLTTEAQPATEDGDMESGVKASENGDGETNSDGQDEKLEDPVSMQVQSSPDTVEGTTVVPVPVYSEAPPSTLSPKVEAESEAPAAPEVAEAALNVQDPACLPGHFQEVSLSDPQENHRTEAGPSEQEPLLLEAKASNTTAEPAGAHSPASTETQSPTRAQSQEEEAQAPKHKTCQCCSVM